MITESGHPTYPNSIDGYKIVRQIGKGAFGTVYEALTPNNLRIAIKSIDKIGIRASGLVQRVRNEVSIHYQLQHRNVLELLHFFEDESYVFLIMELASGGELYQRLRKGPKFNEEEIKSIFCSIVDGLDYLHSHGIIHRDLKLSNILLSSDMTPKIADFGLAVKVDENSDSEQQTLCGTPNYLAPEVILKRPYGKTADIWSLGCLLYTMLVGRPPFDSVDVRDTFTRVTRGDFRIPENLGVLARDLISKLIIVDPDSRLSLEQIRLHPFLNQGREDVSPPLNTLHLKAIQQRTKHGLLQITSDGHVVVDFTKENNVMVISSDGKNVRVFRKPWSNINSTNFEEEFYFPFFSRSIAQRYEYARRFIALIRSKTPQIVLFTDSFKGFLMDNSPIYDFHLRYLNGTRVEYTGPIGHRIVVIREPPNGSESRFENPTISTLNRISNISLRLIVSECLSRYFQCCEVANRISKQRDSLPFPYIIRETLSESYKYISEEITAPQLSTWISAGMASIYPNKSPLSFSDSDRSFEHAYKTFLPNVGWCLASSSEQFLLLFTDGQTILIDGKRNRVAFYDKSLDIVNWHSIDQQLPSPLKQKLVYFPKFVNLLKSGHGHSFVS